MSTPIAWPEAQRICDIPEIHEALSTFSHDSTEDNAVALICAALNAAGTFTQGRAAGLEEAEYPGHHYRKKPVVIEAVQYTEAVRDAHLFDGQPLPGGMRIPSSWTHPPTHGVYSAQAFINTLEGEMMVSLNDWIITGVKGEHYACKPDIFAATYEPVGAISSLPSEEAQGDDKWYLQDTRCYVGNDVMWWAKDGKGYTTDVSKAHVYERDAAFRQAAMRGTDRAWPKVYIDRKTRPAVDMQYINHDEALSSLEVIGKGENG